MFTHDHVPSCRMLVAEGHESQACTGRVPLSTAPPLHGMSARPLLAAASTLPPVRHARVLLACTVWGMRWCTAAPGLATHRMHMRLSLTPSARRQCTHAPPRLANAGERWWEREPRPPFSTPGSHPGAPRGKPRRALRPSPHARTAQLPCRELYRGRGVLTHMRACGRRWACRLRLLGALRCNGASGRGWLGSRDLTSGATTPHIPVSRQRWNYTPSPGRGSR